jgi:hypothetical protein
MTWQWGSLTQGCRRAANALSQYTVALRAAGIMPHDLAFSEHRFLQLLKEADKLGYYSVQACPSDHRKQNSCVCSGDRTDSLTRDLKMNILVIRSRKAWFGCLDCLKSGERRTDGTCRLQHSL